MMALPQGEAGHAATRVLRVLPAALTLAILATVMTFLAWSYVAQPEHPDGVCYESRGHPMPCFELEHRRAAAR